MNGTDGKELKGFVRLTFVGHEVSFPVEFNENRIETTIPPLQEVFKDEIPNGLICNTRLEIFIESRYYTPWQGNIRIDSPSEQPRPQGHEASAKFLGLSQGKIH
jgi:hypothetical protein